MVSIEFVSYVARSLNYRFPLCTACDMCLSVCERFVLVQLLVMVGSFCASGNYVSKYANLFEV